MSYVKSNLNNIFLIIILFFPKIDLISISGFHQGIRIEDLIISYFFIRLFFENRNISRNFVGYDFIIIFPYFTFVCFITTLLGHDMNIVILLRYFEYIILIIYFNIFKINKIFILKSCIIFLIINFLIVILQLYDVVGSFTSLGYQKAGEIINKRYMGLYGGSWELANAVAIIFFIILSTPYINIFSKVIYFFFTVTLIILSQTKTAFLALIISLLFYLLTKLNKFDFKNFIIIILIFGPAIYLLFDYFFYNYLINDDFLNKILSIDYNFLIKIFYEFFLYGNLISLESVDPIYWSIIYRTQHWQDSYNLFLSNPFFTIFGVATPQIYYDSLIIRFIVNFGILGSLFIFLLIIKSLPFYVFIFLFINALTLDLVISFKIFSIIFIYFYHLRLKNYDYRN